MSLCSLMWLGGEVAVVADAAEVAEELAHGDGPLLLREVGDVFLHLVVEVELTALGELQDGDGRHRLGDGGEAVGRLGVCGNLVLQIGVAVALDPDVAVFDEADGERRRAVGRHLPADVLVELAQAGGVLRRHGLVRVCAAASGAWIARASWRRRQEERRLTRGRTGECGKIFSWDLFEGLCAAMDGAVDEGKDCGREESRISLLYPSAAVWECFAPVTHNQTEVTE